MLAFLKNRWRERTIAQKKNQKETMKQLKQEASTSPEFIPKPLQQRPFLLRRDQYDKVFTPGLTMTVDDWRSVKTFKTCPSESVKRGANLLAECWSLPRPGCISDSGHRQRNAADTHHCVGRGRGMQAARLRTLSPMNTARGLEP